MIKLDAGNSFQWTNAKFVFVTRGHCIKGKHFQHITIKNQYMSLCSKQSSLFSFYALHSGGKLKGAVVHLYLSKKRQTVKEREREREREREIEREAVVTFLLLDIFLPASNFV